MSDKCDNSLLLSIILMLILFAVTAIIDHKQNNNLNDLEYRVKMLELSK